MSDENAADEAFEKQVCSPCESSGKVAPLKPGLAAWLRDHLLSVGGLVSAFVALVTLPGLLMSTWNGLWRWIDSLTEPDIVVAVGELNLRCLVAKPPSDSRELTLKKHCDPGNFAVSGRFALTNQDRIARNVTDLRADVWLLGDSDESELYVVLERPLSVRHEVVNGRETVSWFDWTPLNLDAQSSHVEEIAFDQNGMKPTQWKVVRNSLFRRPPAWNRAKFMLWVTVFGEEKEFEILQCESLLNKDHLKLRQNDMGKQYRMPFNCGGDVVAGLGKR